MVGSSPPHHRSLAAGSARPPLGAPSRPAIGWCWRRGGSASSTPSSRSSAPTGRWPCRCDVTEWDQVTATVEAALERFGRIDVVFANAGFGATRGFRRRRSSTGARWCSRTCCGVALTIRATLPHLLERGDGHYVLTSSIAGRRSLPGSLYSATKFAVTGIGQGLRGELRQMHENTAIRVTLIEPGGVETPFFEQPGRAGSSPTTSPEP